MEHSRFLAKLIGPTFLIIGLGSLINAGPYRLMVLQFLHSGALIYISGLFALIVGLAMVLTHNVWDSSWRVIVTALGWLAFLGGGFRILAPREVVSIGNAMISHDVVPIVSGMLVIVVGGVLSYFGYVDELPTSSRRAPAKRRK